MAEKSEMRTWILWKEKGFLAAGCTAWARIRMKGIATFQTIRRVPSDVASTSPCDFPQNTES